MGGERGVGESERAREREREREVSEKLSVLSRTKSLSFSMSKPAKGSVLSRTCPSPSKRGPLQVCPIKDLSKRAPAHVGVIEDLSKPEKVSVLSRISLRCSLLYSLLYLLLYLLLCSTALCSKPLQASTCVHTTPSQAWTC